MPSLWRAASALLAMYAAPAAAQSNKVNISNLSDVVFGSLANVGVDAVNSQSICVYSSTATNGYQVTATGSGSGNAFAMSSGLSTLPYDVQWNASAGQSSGTQLTAGATLTGQISSANQKTCNSGPANSASLIVILRSSALSKASAGDYSGTLTLLIGPE
jgi:hypothetical protein